MEQERGRATPPARDEAGVIMPLRVIALPATVLSGRAVCQSDGVPGCGNDCLKISCARSHLGLQVRLARSSVISPITTRDRKAAV